jgi:hypothetical protein
MIPYRAVLNKNLHKQEWVGTPCPVCKKEMVESSMCDAYRLKTPDSYVLNHYLNWSFCCCLECKNRFELSWEGDNKQSKRIELLVKIKNDRKS